jgi:hypothetical protein
LTRAGVFASRTTTQQLFDLTAGSCTVVLDPSAYLVSFFAGFQTIAMLSSTENDRGTKASWDK